MNPLKKNNMKKAYINPEAGYMEMAVENLMGASKNPDGFSAELDNENTINPEDMLSRHNSVWDEEEENW